MRVRVGRVCSHRILRLLIGGRLSYRSAGTGSMTDKGHHAFYTLFGIAPVMAAIMSVNASKDMHFSTPKAPGLVVLTRAAVAVITAGMFGANCLAEGVISEISAVTAVCGGLVAAGRGRCR